MKKYLVIGVSLITVAACQPKTTPVAEALPTPSVPETLSMTKTASQMAAEEAALEAEKAQEAVQVASADTGKMCLTSSVLANDYVTLIPAGTAGTLDNGRFTYNGKTHDISNTNYSVKPC